MSVLSYCRTETFWGHEPRNHQSARRGHYRIVVVLLLYLVQASAIVGNRGGWEARSPKKLADALLRWHSHNTRQKKLMFSSRGSGAGTFAVMVLTRGSYCLPFFLRRLSPEIRWQCQPPTWLSLGPERDHPACVFLLPENMCGERILPASRGIIRFLLVRCGVRDKACLYCSCMSGAATLHLLHSLHLLPLFLHQS